MSSNEMIERVAKAIALRDTTDEFAMARAAIEAMREPTEDMISITGSNDLYERDFIASLYRRMINEILK